MGLRLRDVFPFFRHPRGEVVEQATAAPGEKRKLACSECHKQAPLSGGPIRHDFWCRQQ